jgi:hypothetical protein
MRRRCIRLGELIVQQLGCDNRGDTLSHWMAHYVAEQITAADTMTGKAKRLARERCCRTILLLWEHRASLPNGHRPLENFEPILRVLVDINPESPRPFYHRLQPAEDAVSESAPGTVQSWVDFIVRIDYAARVLIEMGLDNACELARDKQTVALLKEALPSGRKTDVKIVRRLVDRAEENSNPAAKLIESKIAKLKAFATICARARMVLEKDLRRLVRRGAEGRAAKIGGVRR